MGNLKKSSAVIFMILTISYILFMANGIQAETVFPETKPISKTEKVYSEQNIVGKEIYTVNVFPNQSYYVYIGLDTSTLVKLPYPIENDINLAAADVIDVIYKKGESFFFVKPKRDNTEGIKTNLHVFCKNNFHVLLNIEIVSKAKANKQVNILDGISEQKKEPYTQDSFWAMRRELEDQLYQKCGNIENLLFSDSIRYPLDNRLSVNEFKIRLINLTIVSNRFYYSLEWDEGLGLDFQDSELFLTDYENRILSEIKSGRTLYTPVEVIRYLKTESGRNRVTLVFEINSHKDTFYSTLMVNNNKFIFEDKIDLALLSVKNQNMFDRGF